MFGLNENAISAIRSTFMQFPEAEKVIIFGSRAMGNFKKGSDIDLAVMGDKMNTDILMKIHVNLNEKLALAYFFDVVEYNNINNPALKEHIDKEGKIFYERESLVGHST